MTSLTADTATKALGDTRDVAPSKLTGRLVAEDSELSLSATLETGIFTLDPSPL
jgi:hypothetical protein